MVSGAGAGSGVARPGRSAWADAVAAVSAAAAAFTVRFSVEVPVWQVAVAVSAGQLLSQVWPVQADDG